MIQILLIVYLSQFSWASISALNVSKLSNEPPTVYFGQLGFKIHAENTDWYQVDVSKIKSKTVQTEYRSLDDKNPGRLTVRSELLKKNYSLSEYIKQSVRDYRRFGFKVLDTRPLKINNNQAFVLDLDKEDSDSHTRQILFKKNNTVVIMTCTGHRFKFQSDLKACNQIARNFTWIKQH